MRGLAALLALILAAACSTKLGKDGRTITLDGNVSYSDNTTTSNS